MMIDNKLSPLRTLLYIHRTRDARDVRLVYVGYVVTYENDSYTYVGVSRNVVRLVGPGQLVLTRITRLLVRINT